MATDFFERQDIARRNTTRLVILFVLAVLAIMASIDLLLAATMGYLARDPETGAIDWTLAADPQLLGLALIHFAIDGLKYSLGSRRPSWVTAPYFIDQGVHFLSVLLVARWIESLGPELPLAITPALAIIASAYVVVTHVWFVTEKTLAHAETGYRSEVENSLWPRMLARAAFLSGLLVLLVGRAVPLLALGTTVRLPYYKDTHWRRALITDLLVAVLTAVFVRLAAGPL